LNNSYLFCLLIIIFICKLLVFHYFYTQHTLFKFIFNEIQNIFQLQTLRYLEFLVLFLKIVILRCNVFPEISIILFQIEVSLRKGFNITLFHGKELIDFNILEILQHMVPEMLDLLFVHGEVMRMTLHSNDKAQHIVQL